MSVPQTGGERQIDTEAGLRYFIEVFWFME